jgi:hypothetical protein
MYSIDVSLDDQYLVLAWWKYNTNNVYIEEYDLANGNLQWSQTLYDNGQYEPKKVKYSPDGSKLYMVVKSAGTYAGSYVCNMFEYDIASDHTSASLTRTLNLQSISSSGECSKALEFNTDASAIFYWHYDYSVYKLDLNDLSTPAPTVIAGYNYAPDNAGVDGVGTAARWSGHSYFFKLRSDGMLVTEEQESDNLRLVTVETHADVFTGCAACPAGKTSLFQSDAEDDCQCAAGNYLIPEATRGNVQELVGVPNVGWENRIVLLEDDGSRILHCRRPFGGTHTFCDEIFVETGTIINRFSLDGASGGMNALSITPDKGIVFAVTGPKLWKITVSTWTVELWKSCISNTEWCGAVYGLAVTSDGNYLMVMNMYSPSHLKCRDFECDARGACV